jgi:ribonuclease HI
LDEHNKIQLLWLPGHKANEGNENADKLEKRGLAVTINKI